MYEDDIPRLRRCLSAGDPIEQGKGGTSSDSSDECPAVHHSLRMEAEIRDVTPRLRAACITTIDDRTDAGLSVSRTAVATLEDRVAIVVISPVIHPARGASCSGRCRNYRQRQKRGYELRSHVHLPWLLVES